MEHITLFFCDLRNTYMEEKNEDRKLTITNFIDNINKLQNINNSEKIFFSFITADNFKTLYPYLTEFHKYISNNIEIYNQYCEDGYYSKKENKFYKVTKENYVFSKPVTIIDSVKELKEEYIIDHIYFADDTPLYHIWVHNLFKCLIKDIKITSFIPSNINNNKAFTFSKLKGLEGVNHCIEQYLSKKNDKSHKSK